MQRTGKSFLPVLFTLLVSGQTRRELMLTRQALAKKALSEKQSGRRKVRADKLRYIRDAQLATLSAAYDIQKQALDLRHAEEIKPCRSRNGAISRPGATSYGTNGGRNSGSGTTAAGRATAAKPAAAIRVARANRAAARLLPCPWPANESTDHFANANRILAEKPKRPTDSPVKKGIHAGGRTRIRSSESRMETAQERRGTQAGWQLQAAAAQGTHSEDVMYGPIPAPHITFSRCEILA